LGLLINFNVPTFKRGISRIILLFGALVVIFAFAFLVTAEGGTLIWCLGDLVVENNSFLNI